AGTGHFRASCACRDSHHKCPADPSLTGGKAGIGTLEYFFLKRSVKFICQSRIRILIKSTWFFPQWKKAGISCKFLVGEKINRDFKQHPEFILNEVAIFLASYHVDF